MAEGLKFGVVTGSNRGLGLEMCSRLKSQGYTIYGACRRSSPELDRLGVEVIPGVDVGRDDGVGALSRTLGDKKVRAWALHLKVTTQIQLARLRIFIC